MDRNIAKKQELLEQILRNDEIFSAYEASVRDLEPGFEEIARNLPEQQRRVLVGYGECLKLMQLRLMTLVCERMDFTE